MTKISNEDWNAIRQLEDQYKIIHAERSKACKDRSNHEDEHKYQCECPIYQSFTNQISRQYHELQAIQQQITDIYRKNGGLACHSRGIGLDWIQCYMCGKVHVVNDEGKVCSVNHNIAAYVHSREEGRAIERAIKWSRLDWREDEPTYIQIKIGACDKHLPNLQKLDALIARNGTITREMIAESAPKMRWYQRHKYDAMKVRPEDAIQPNEGLAMSDVLIGLDLTDLFTKSVSECLTKTNPYSFIIDMDKLREKEPSLNTIEPSWLFSKIAQKIHSRFPVSGLGSGGDGISLCVDHLWFKDRLKKLKKYQLWQRIKLLRVQAKYYQLKQVIPDVKAYSGGTWHADSIIKNFEQMHVQVEEYIRNDEKKEYIAEIWFTKKVCGVQIVGERHWGFARGDSPTTMRIESLQSLESMGKNGLSFEKLPFILHNINNPAYQTITTTKT